MRTSLSLLALCLAALSLRAEEEKPPKPKGKYDMTYDELANLKIASSASLTATDERRTPASVTRIDQAMIRQSGARNLLELLSIYVPGFQSQPSHQALNSFGIRGVTSNLNLVSHEFYAPLHHSRPAAAPH